MATSGANALSVLLFSGHGEFETRLFSMKLTSNNGFLLFIDVLIKLYFLERSQGLNCHLKLKLCARANQFFQ